MIKYTKLETLQHTKDGLKDNPTEKIKGMDKFYALGIVNWSGKTPKRDATQEYYSEIISGHFLDTYKKETNDEEFRNKLAKKITPLTREKSYDCDEKARKTSSEATDNRGEEKIAKRLWEASNQQKTIFNKIGKFIKHQMPLKDHNQKDEKYTRAGKVDLVSYDAKTGKVFLIEFKKPNNTETLLRCGLEAFTYWAQLNKEKFVKDFADTSKLPSNFNLKNIVPAVLVYKGRTQDCQYNQERPNTCNLLTKLGVECFTIDEMNNIAEMQLKATEVRPPKENKKAKKQSKK